MRLLNSPFYKEGSLVKTGFKFAALVAAAATPVFGGLTARADDAATAPAVAHGTVIGNQECVNCHAAEKDVWEATKHKASWDLRRLAGKPPVSDMLAAIGSTQRRPTDEPVCMNCHFTVVDSKATLGVSCESCHGAASDWKDVHNNKDAMPDKAARMEASRQKGMIHPAMKQALMQNCFGCHNYDSGNVPGDTIAKMLGAGHPAFDFEFVAFSQGTVKHRFYPPDTSVNADMSAPDLARWYVIGQGGQLVSAAKVLAANSGVDVIKTSQQAKIDAATKVLSAIDLPEAKALVGEPTDANLSKLIIATGGKDFTAQVGSMVPAASSYK
jgi:mono/diheme cytochrome c family protein